MIETIILSALEAGTETPAYMEMPEQKPERFCMLW